jgi:hypothetical protein
MERTSLRDMRQLSRRAEVAAVDTQAAVVALPPVHRMRAVAGSVEVVVAMRPEAGVAEAGVAAVIANALSAEIGARRLLI